MQDFEWEQLNFMDMLSNLSDYKIHKPVRLIELFGGIGAQAMALERLGVPMEHYRLIEWDKYPIKSYNAIHGTNFKPMDITKIHGWDLGVTEKDKYTYLLTYSFPCQDLSVAGKGRGMKKGDQTRSGLLWEVERLLDESPLLPDVMIMENVPNVHLNKNKEDFRSWLDYLSSKGFSNYYEDLNAADYGIPQSRKRCFCVSILGNYNYKFPKPIKLPFTMADFLEDETEDKYYVNTDKAKKLINELVMGGKIPASGQTQVNKCIGGLSDHLWGTQYHQQDRVYEMTDLCMALPAQIPGGSYKYMEIKVIGRMDHTMDHTFESANRVYGVDGISPTIPTCAGGNIQPKIVECVAMRGQGDENKQQLEKWTWEIDGEVYLIRIRKLTPRECWRLMDFNEGAFEKAQEVNSNTQLYKQAGNSIVVNCLVAIMGQLFEGKENEYVRKL